MKKIIPLWPVLFFALLIPFVRMAETHRTIIVLAFSVGSAIAVMMSYVLFGKRDFPMGIFGFFLAIIMAFGSILIIYKLMPGEVFTPDLSVRHIFSIIAVALMASIAEEFIFRGLVLWFLLRYFKKIPVFILLSIQAVLFTVSHKNGTPVFVFLTFGFGLFFGWTAYKTRSLWFPIGFHFGWDIIIVFATGFHSLNFGHIKGMVIFNNDFPGVDNLVFLVALGLSAMMFVKFVSRFQTSNHKNWTAVIE
ncbi:CPBP family intramembrane metalloprotease [Oxalobacteraceae bacterium OTU3REALA1]|nr:CPBP family intramembrane metalloprotease [Oxalobacteraceae bacterium OTU3REALA1]